MDWSGAAAYRATQLQDWLVDGEPAGKWRSASGLTFATIHAAGHMVRRKRHRATNLITCAQAPFDKPKESLALLQRWIDGGKL